MSSSSEDDILYWQDALDYVMSGRTEGMPKCPFCYTGNIQVTKMVRKTRLECEKCHHFIEGRFPEDPDVEPAPATKKSIPTGTPDK